MCGFEPLRRYFSEFASRLSSGIIHAAPGGIRTPNPRFRRPMLYPVELRVLSAQRKMMTKALFLQTFKPVTQNFGRGASEMSWRNRRLRARRSPNVSAETITAGFPTKGMRQANQYLAQDNGTRIRESMPCCSFADAIEAIHARAAWLTSDRNTAVCSHSEILQNMCRDGLHLRAHTRGSTSSAP